MDGYRAEEIALSYFSVNNLGKLPLLIHRLQSIYFVYKFLQFWLNTRLEKAIIVMRWDYLQVLKKITFEFTKDKEAVRDIKQDKTRIPALVCCNAERSDKVRPTIIGKYANPLPQSVV